MAGVTFFHPNPALGTLNVRLAPTAVNWSYKMNTATTQTYAGEVVQILGVNFQKFSIEGQFGREGPHGRDVVAGKIQDRSLTSQDSWRDAGKYGIGLTQMTAFFRQYFTLASQGINDVDPNKNFDERPMHIVYQGALDVPLDIGKDEQHWLVYPTSFPSYRRSLEDFAPQWRVECEVAEVPGPIKTAEYSAALKRLRSAVGYTPFNPYSDPLGQILKPGASTDKAAYNKAVERASIATDDLLDFYREQIPALTPESLNELIFSGGSAATVYQQSLNGDKIDTSVGAPVKPTRSTSVGGGD